MVVFTPEKLLGSGYGGYGAFIIFGAYFTSIIKGIKQPYFFYKFYLALSLK